MHFLHSTSSFRGTPHDAVKEEIFLSGMVPFLPSPSPLFTSRMHPRVSATDEGIELFPFVMTSIRLRIHKSGSCSIWLHGITLRLHVKTVAPWYKLKIRDPSPHARQISTLKGALPPILEHIPLSLTRTRVHFGSLQPFHFTYRNDDAYKSHSADIWMKGRHRHGHLVNTMKQMCRRHLQWVSSRALDYIGAPLDLPNYHVAVVDQSTDDLSKGDGHLTLTRRVGNWKFHQIIKVSFLIIILKKFILFLGSSYTFLSIRYWM